MGSLSIPVIAFESFRISTRWLLSVTCHAHNWPGDDVSDQSRVERLGGKILVVLLSHGLGGLIQLKALELESLALESADDLT